MESLWPDDFSVEGGDFNTPNQILEEQAKLLSEKTSGVVYGELNKLSKGFLDLDFKSFNYEFGIRGKFIDDYMYRVLTIHYDIIIYPLLLKINQDIADVVSFGEKEIKINNEGEFKEHLKGVFNTNTVKNVIISIRKMSEHMLG